MAYINNRWKSAMDEIVIRSMSFLLTTGMMWSARTFLNRGYGRRTTLQAR